MEPNKSGEKKQGWDWSRNIFNAREMDVAFYLQPSGKWLIVLKNKVVMCTIQAETGRITIIDVEKKGGDNK
jgi:hypothetical protein